MGRGPGRPSKADEQRVRTLSTKAIVQMYGSEEKGFKALLTSGDPSLTKWVFEHAYGKPKERVDITSDDEKIGGVQVEVLRTIASAHAEIAN